MTEKKHIKAIPSDPSFTKGKIGGDLNTGVVIAEKSKAADTQRILEERARLLARIPESKAGTGEILEVQTFHLGAEYFGVPTGLVQEIQPLRAHHWSRVPCVPPFIVGIVNLRGRIYSIMDLAVFWGLRSRPVTEKTHILLVRGINRSDNEEIDLTLITDDCAEVQHIRLDDIKPPPPNVSAKVQSYIQGVTPDMMMVVDLESLLSDPHIIIAEGD